jgi:hypothetical protein
VAYLAGPWHVSLVFRSHPSKLVNSLKGVSARLLRKEYDSHIRSYLWGGHVWSGSYFAGSVRTQVDGEHMAAVGAGDELVRMRAVLARTGRRMRVLRRRTPDRRQAVHRKPEAARLTVQTKAQRTPALRTSEPRMRFTPALKGGALRKVRGR